jgi:hypothetical protein
MQKHLSEIVLVRVENPHSLDQFFMDNDIIDFIKTEFAESDHQ